MNVLVVLHRFNARTGGQVFVLDLVTMLAGLGHQVDVAFVEGGPLVADLVERGASLRATLDEVVVVPDVAYVNSTAEALVVATRWPDVPIVFHCHGLDDWTTEVPALRAVRWFACTGKATRDQLVRQGAPPERITVVPNGVDLERLAQRPPLPERPHRLGVFSSSATLEDVAGLQRACRDAGYELELFGAALGNETSDPARALRGIDVVFACTRAAMEAIAVGCAVVLWNQHGWYGLITPTDVEEALSENFGQPLYRRSNGDATWLDELDRYSREDAERVREMLVGERSLEAIAATVQTVLTTAVASDPWVDEATERRWIEGWTRSMSMHRLAATDHTFDRSRHIAWLERELTRATAPVEGLEWLGEHPVARQEMRHHPNARVGASPRREGWVTVPLVEVARAPWIELPTSGTRTGWMADRPDAVLDLGPVGPLRVVFWSHAWSGAALVRIGGREERVELHDDAGGFVVVTVLGSPADAPVTIRPEGSDDPRRQQVIVCDVQRIAERASRHPAPDP